MGKSSKIEKVCWANDTDRRKDTIHPGAIETVRELEKKGFGMLKDPNSSSEIIDKSESVVCPDNTIYTLEEISSYFQKNNNPDPENLEYTKMKEAETYLAIYNLP